MEAAGRPRLPAAHRSAIPLGERRLRDRSTRSWRRCRPASARPSGASGATRLPRTSTVDWLTGTDLTEAAWDAFFAFYMETGSRKWGRPYLTRQFYSLIGADHGRQDPAGDGEARRALYRRRDQLHRRRIRCYGRHWGAIEHHPFLHFELCYYQAIEFAIEHKLKRVEAGAQGEHKLARGYLPVTTYSAHYIADPALRRAIADYLMRERAYVAAAGEELAAMAPFRKDLAERNRTIFDTLRRTAMPSYDPQQHLRENPARRTALPQGLRGRQGARVPRHHAARARPHAGAAEGAGAKPARRQAGRSRRTSPWSRRRSPTPR